MSTKIYLQNMELQTDPQLLVRKIKFNQSGFTLIISNLFEIQIQGNNVLISDIYQELTEDQKYQWNQRHQSKISVPASAIKLQSDLPLPNGKRYIFIN